RTNFPTNAEVNYGLTPEILDKTVTTVEYEERHEVNLTDLQEGTTYWFTILACDEHMNCANTTPENFTTAVKVELFLEIDEPKINASATEDYFYHDTYELDIKGRTAPYSDIDVFMNGNHKRFKRMYEQTVFQFSSIDLDPTLEENLFKITADDREGHILSIEKKILVDRFEPDIKNVTIPGFTPESHFTVSGNMSDVTDVDVNMYLLKPSFAFHSVGDPNGEFAEYYNQQGPQTMLAYEVKQAAEQIANASTYKGVVQNIMNWISQNLGSETCNEDARSLERHAKEIIVSKCAVSSEDLTVAFVALSRAKGIPAKYVQAVEESWLACVNDYSIDAENCLPRRTQAFSEVYIDDKKTWYAVDVAAKAFTEKDMGEHFVPKGEYSGSTMLTLGYGRDAWSLNIRDQESMNSALMMGLSQGYSDQLTSIFVDSTKIYSDGTTNARPFNAQLGPLEEGKNAVLIEFVDQAGNARTFEREIIYDTTPPRITTPTDLMIYSPSYVWEIKINGQVDDIAEVYVFVNKDPSDLSNAQRSVMTDNNGTFDIQVDLAVAGYAGSDLKPDWDNTSEPAQEHEVGIGAGVVSHVTLIAVDEAGQMSDPVSGEILFGQCSEGNADWKITVTDASPASLNTRELLEGIASFGFAFNLTWQGGGDAKNAQVADVVVRSAPIGQAYEGKQYDKAEDYITIQRALNNNRTRGVVLANFKPVASEGNTTYELEEHISQRGKDGMCMIPEVGCFKFLLTLEVSYSYSDPSGSGYYGYQGGSQEQTFGQQPQTLQKHCFPIEIMVDERMDPSIIPNDFLNKTVQFLDQVIKFIDMVLGPLTQITKYVLIGCLVMMIAVFATNIAKQFSCKWSSVLATQNFKDAIKDAIGGKGGLRSAAEQGLCEQIYEGDGKEAAKAACETCSQKVKTYQKTRFAH
ncbi:MAG: transglutaminase domain-containing protein, partial [Candidatus Nanoarchaeia archaeon]